MFANGRIPLDRLRHLGGDHYLPAGTAARWLWVVMMAMLKYGVRLRITPGWNAYRPLHVQVEYRDRLGRWAAVPGFSTHGGVVGGREVFAIDVDNWAELGWARFAALCRLAGITVDFVTPQELWHVGDFNDPWVVPDFANGGGGSHLNPGSTTTLILEEDDDMKHLYITDSVDGNNIPGWLLLNPRTAEVMVQRNTGKASEQEQANSWARVWGPAKVCTRQDYLNAEAAIRGTL